MFLPDFLALYRCKTAYNPEDTLLDTLASIRQERLDRIARAICLRVAKHENYAALKGDDINKFDELIRPLIMASQFQRRMLVHRKTEVTWQEDR